MELLVTDNNLDKDIEQIKRYEKAVISNIKIISIDKDNSTAKFEGSSGEIYNTTLSNCTCVDFFRRKRPCKHMYKLAIELGAINPDSKKWKKYSTYSKKVNNIKKKLNMLSLEQLDILSDFIKELIQSE